MSINKIYNSLIVFLIFILFYIFYKSEIVYLSNKRNFYLFYFLITLILLFIFFIVLKLKKIKKIFLIIFFSLVVSFYMFEIYLISFNEISIEMVNEYKKKTGLKFDKRSKLEIYNDIYKKNKNIKMVIRPSLFLDDSFKSLPLSGFSLSETINCNENGYYSIYKSDRFGFNNPNNVWERKPEVLLLGDSFIHGACVNRPNDIASRLRFYSNMNIINLGYSGNGPLLNFATLKEFISENTSIVLYFFFEGNDFINLQEEWKSKILQDYLNQENFNQDFKIKKNNFDKILEAKMENEINNIKQKEYFIKFINFLKLNKSRLILISHMPYYFRNKTRPISETYNINDLEQKNLKILNNLKELTNRHNSKLYIVYLPSWERQKSKYYKQDDLYYSYDPRIYELIKKNINYLEIELIDIQKNIFNLEKNPLSLFPFSQRGHYVADAYDKMAKFIIGKIN